MSEPVILRWARAIPLGFYRSLVLVGLTVMPVAVAAAAGSAARCSRWADLRG